MGLTVQSVEVSVFARHGDNHRVQAFLRPLLQTLELGLVHLLRGLQLVQVASRVGSPGEGEQSTQADNICFYIPTGPLKVYRRIKADLRGTKKGAEVK